MHSSVRLSAKETAYLKKLGLSNHAVAIYAVLAQQQKPLSVATVATKLEVLPNAVYRICYDLEKIGLIHRISGRPLQFKAINRSEAYSQSFLQVKQELAVQLQSLAGTSATGPSADTRTMIGRQALYNAYADLAATAQHEICVYAIGIAYTDALYATQKSAINRGVHIRHVVQQLKKDNYFIVNKWQKLGVRMRLLKSPRGFHLNIIDNRVALIAFSNPLDTEDRLTIITYSPAAVLTMARLFEEMWQEAGEINL